MQLNEPISLYDLQNLCNLFEIDIKISKENDYIAYHLGPVKWLCEPNTLLTVDAYFKIAMRLAAMLPHKVIQGA